MSVIKIKHKKCKHEGIFGLGLYIEPPVRRLISYRKINEVSAKLGKPVKYSLQIPWTIYGIDIDKSAFGNVYSVNYLSWSMRDPREKPLKVSTPLIPNVDDELGGIHSVCLGTTKQVIAPHEDVIYEKHCLTAISEFWQSSFNDGLQVYKSTEAYDQLKEIAKKKHKSVWTVWEKLSLVELRKLPWDSSKCKSLDQYINIMEDNC